MPIDDRGNDLQVRTWQLRLDAGQFGEAAEALKQSLDSGETGFSTSEAECLKGILFHSDTKLRQQAVRAVGLAGDVESIPALAKLFDDGLDWFDHDYIFDAFKSMGEPAVPHLAELVERGNEGERSAVLQGLGRIGGDAVPVLLAEAGRRLDDIVLTALYNAHDSRAVPLLLEMVQRGGDLTEDAAIALAASCDPTCTEAVEPLLRLLRACPDFAALLIEALGHINDPRAIPALQRALRRGGDAAESAASSLCQMADPRASAALLAAMAEPRLTGHARQEVLRAVLKHAQTPPADRCAAARIVLKDFERFPDLEDLLGTLGANHDCRAEVQAAAESDDPFLQLGAAVALDSRDLFLRATRHTSRAVRVRCAELASKINSLTTEDVLSLARDPEVLVRRRLADDLWQRRPHSAALMAALIADRSARVRTAAASRLWFIPSEQAVTHIEHLALDRSPAVRQQAAKAAAVVKDLSPTRRIDLLARFLYDLKGCPVDPLVGMEIHNGQEEVPITVSMKLESMGASSRRVLQEWKRRGGKKGQPPSGDPFRWD